MIVLDTNVISEIFRPSPEPRVVDWLMSLTGDVAITPVTLAELLAGVRRLPDGRRREELTMRIDAALAPYRGGRADRRDLSGTWSDLRDEQREGLCAYWHRTG